MRAGNSGYGRREKVPQIWGMLSEELDLHGDTRCALLFGHDQMTHMYVSPVAVVNLVHHLRSVHLLVRSAITDV